MDRQFAGFLLMIMGILLAVGMLISMADPMRATSSVASAPPPPATPPVAAAPSAPAAPPVAAAPPAPAAAPAPAAPAPPVAAQVVPASAPAPAPAPAAAAPPIPQPTSDLLRAARLTAPLTADDPGADYWNTAAKISVPMLAQMMAMPTLDSPSVTSVDVQAVTDGQRIAFRLKWSDATADMNVDTGRFTDAVAIQFPLTPNAPFMMGARGMKVQILHWKAIWQKDIDEHFQDVQDLHPNYWTDLYWFATPVKSAPGTVAYRVPASFENPVSRKWLIAYSAGNPMSEIHRKQPVEELLAEGFGTLTHQKRSATTGKGAWKDGAWTVVFSRPLNTDDPQDYQLRAGETGMLGFAVWEGSAGNVGARKQWTNFVNLEVPR